VLNLQDKAEKLNTQSAEVYHCYQYMYVSVYICKYVYIYVYVYAYI